MSVYFDEQILLSTISYPIRYFKWYQSYMYRHNYLSIRIFQISCLTCVRKIEIKRFIRQPNICTLMHWPILENTSFLILGQIFWFLCLFWWFIAVINFVEHSRRGSKLECLLIKFCCLLERVLDLWWEFPWVLVATPPCVFTFGVMHIAQVV